jgi:hypothetical protein
VSDAGEVKDKHTRENLGKLVVALKQLYGEQNVKVTDGGSLSGSVELREVPFGR